MTHPMEHLSPRARVQLLVPALLVLLGLSWFFLTVAARPVTTPAAPLGLLSFQMAGSAERASAVIASWGEAGRLWMAFGLGIDYIYILAYALVLPLGCTWAARVARSHWFAAMGRLLAWATLVAALADLAENVALWVELLGPVQDPWPAFAWWMSVLKLTFFYAPVVYTVLGTGVWILRPRH